MGFLISGFNHGYAQTTFVARNAFYGELGGKSIIYGLYYENLYRDDLGLNVGISVIPRSLNFGEDDKPYASATEDTSTVIVPAFVSWYPLGKRDRLFIDGGLDLMLLLRKQALSTGLLGTVGFGYNYRPREDGYYIKFGPLLILGFGGPRSMGIRTMPWFGIAVGKVF